MKLPSQEALKKLLWFDELAGQLLWLPRVAEDQNKFFSVDGWNKKFAGKPAFALDKTGYVRGRLLNKRVLAHRVIWKYLYDEEPVIVEHKNNNPSSNFRLNLRSANFAQNNRNRGVKVGVGSIYRGVYLHKHRLKWQASITYLGKKIHLGSFETEVEAAKAYNKAATEYFGAFANINRIGD